MKWLDAELTKVYSIINFNGGLTVAAWFKEGD